MPAERRTRRTACAPSATTRRACSNLTLAVLPLDWLQILAPESRTLRELPVLSGTNSQASLVAWKGEEASLPPFFFVVEGNPLLGISKLVCYSPCNDSLWRNFGTV